MSLFFIIPLVAALMIASPLIIASIRVFRGKKCRAKSFLKLNFVTFVLGCAFFTVMFPLGVFATAENPAETAATALSIGDGLKYLSAALATGLSSLGAGISVKGAASSAIGAISENEKIFGKAIVFVALAEGVAIYGVLISALILFL